MDLLLLNSANALSLYLPILLFTVVCVSFSLVLLSRFPLHFPFHLKSLEFFSSSVKPDAIEGGSMRAKHTRRVAHINV